MADVVHDAERLKELQSLPLERKIQISQTRIIEWYQHYNGQVVVSFSGGKDSTVLLHLVRSIYPDVKAVFSNTGLEYPEIQKHVRSIENVDIVVPSMRFDEVISTYGYPLIGKEVAEAIYYARRIRSQSVKVEREREREQRVQAATRTEAERTAWKETARRRGNLKPNYNQKQFGGAERTKSNRESPSQQTDKSSHQDKHCEEQTNRADGQDGWRKRTGGSAGVASSNWGGQRYAAESNWTGLCHRQRESTESAEPG